MRVSLPFPPIAPGATIGVVAPSRWVPAEELKAGKAVLEQAGFQVKIHAQCHFREHQFAGTLQQKVLAMEEYYADPAIAAILCASGGNRALHLLSRLNYELIAANPKPLIGYSDTTALLAAIYVKTGQGGIHGPSVSTLGKAAADGDTTTLPCFMNALLGQGQAFSFPTGHIIRTGTASGPLVGGNLSLFVNLIGTPYMPDVTGAILFLEDVDEEIRQLDRMLLHLKTCGMLSKISGLLIGQMSGTNDTGSRPYGYTWQDIVTEHTAELKEGTPVVMDAPFGHIGPLPSFPIGAHATLDALKFPPRLEIEETAQTVARSA